MLKGRIARAVWLEVVCTRRLAMLRYHGLEEFEQLISSYFVLCCNLMVVDDVAKCEQKPSAREKRCVHFTGSYVEKNEI
jgi:hypothetical protein